MIVVRRWSGGRTIEGSGSGSLADIGGGGAAEDCCNLGGARRPWVGCTCWGCGFECSGMSFIFSLPGPASTDCFAAGDTDDPEPALFDPNALPSSEFDPMLKVGRFSFFPFSRLSLLAIAPRAAPPRPDPVRLIAPRILFPPPPPTPTPLLVLVIISPETTPATTPVPASRLLLLLVLVLLLLV